MAQERRQHAVDDVNYGMLVTGSIAPAATKAERMTDRLDRHTVLGTRAILPPRPFEQLELELKLVFAWRRSGERIAYQPRGDVWIAGSG
jgi:uncharacterized protein YcaQ